jgi:hypothetical protein
LSGSDGARTVGLAMEFLVELYVSTTDVGAVQRLAKSARVAAEEQAGRGVPVRHLRSIFVPEEETCFMFCDAPSRDAVRDAARLAELPFVCIAAAVAASSETTDRERHIDGCHR